MTPRKEMFVREYWENSGNIYRVRVYQADGPEQYVVKIFDTASNELENQLELQHFPDGGWGEEKAGITSKAKEYGKFIDQYARLYNHTHVVS